MMGLKGTKGSVKRCKDLCVLSHTSGFQVSGVEVVHHRPANLKADVFQCFPNMLAVRSQLCSCQSIRLHAAALRGFEMGIEVYCVKSCRFHICTSKAA